MASIENILQLIVDRPGMTASELGEQLELAPADVQSRLVKYIDAGQVKRDKKKVDGRELLTYFPAQSLIDEADGVKRIVKPAAVKRAAAAVAAPPGTDFTFGFFSNGGLSIAKGTREIRLDRGETTRLIEFLDAINVDQISASA